MKWENKGHEFDEIGGIFQSNRDLYIWGTTALAADLAVRLKALGITPRLIDDDRIWNAIGWSGLDVVTSPQVLNSPEGKTVVVAYEGLRAEDCFRNLECAGFIREKSCFGLYEFRDKWLSVFAVYVSGKVYFKDISFIPSTKCNLNCRCCLNLTPFLKTMKDEPIEELKKQIDLFFSRVDYIGLFHVSGGEPILYPHLTELLAYLDERYRPQIHQLATTTNGTREFSEEVCRSLREHHVLLIVDDYTEAIPNNAEHFQALLARLERCGVWTYLNKAETWIDLAPERTDNRSMTDQELRDYYTACGIQFREYYGGKLYACNYAHYAEKAGLTVCDESEYLDFWKLTREDSKTLVECRLGYSDKGYMEFCKICAGFDNNPYRVPPAEQAQRLPGISCE